jgi:hypothetical protein
MAKEIEPAGVTHQLESAERGTNLGKQKKASERTEGTYSLESVAGGTSQDSGRKRASGTHVL